MARTRRPRPRTLKQREEALQEWQRRISPREQLHRQLQTVIEHQTNPVPDESVVVAEYEHYTRKMDDLQKLKAREAGEARVKLDAEQEHRRDQRRAADIECERFIRSI